MADFVCVVCPEASIEAEASVEAEVCIESAMLQGELEEVIPYMQQMGQHCQHHHSNDSGGGEGGQDPSWAAIQEHLQVRHLGLGFPTGCLTPDRPWLHDLLQVTPGLLDFSQAAQLLPVLHGYMSFLVPFSIKRNDGWNGCIAAWKFTMQKLHELSCAIFNDKE
eukprot:1149306-Pelagomonas_calceolata.AAC.1